MLHDDGECVGCPSMSCLLQIGSFIIHWLLSRLIIIDLRSSEYFSCDDARIIISTRALYSVGYFLYDDVCRSTTSKLHILIGYFFTCVTSVGACVFLACFCTSLRRTTDVFSSSAITSSKTVKTSKQQSAKDPTMIDGIIGRSSLFTSIDIQ